MDFVSIEFPGFDLDVLMDFHAFPSVVHRGSIDYSIDAMVVVLASIKLRQKRAEPQGIP